VVLRLLRGEKLEEVSREVGAEAHRLAAWRNEFLDAGKDGPKGRRATTEEDRRLRDAERKIGKLTLENKIWKKVAEKRGSRCRHRSGRGGRRDGDSLGYRLSRHPSDPVHHLSPQVSISIHSRGFPPDFPGIRVLPTPLWTPSYGVLPRMRCSREPVNFT
jgi:hypothetical protein